jgi:AraC family transcriptional activator of pobA
METKISKLLNFNKVRDFYTELGLAPDRLSPDSDFSIYNLKTLNLDFPKQSPIYRANFFSFVFAKHAFGKCHCDGNRFDILPGTVYFNNPGYIRQFSLDYVESLHYLTLSEGFLKENVHPEVFDEFPFLLCESLNPKVLNPAQFSELEHLYLQIQNAYESTSPYKNRLIGHLMVAVLLKIKEFWWQGSSMELQSTRASEITNKFKIMLEKHYRELSKGMHERANRVQDYADELCLHPNYLNNIVKSQTGKSVGCWIAEKTISEAKSLLRNSTIPLKEISYRLGFIEPQNFSTYFKKHTQSTPLIYRQSM